MKKSYKSQENKSYALLIDLNLWEIKDASMKKVELTIYKSFRVSY